MKDEKFDIKNFDVDMALEKVRKEVKKPGIFVCGATGVGKSSLVNDIFNYSLFEAPKTGDGAPITRGIDKYENDELGVILYDSEGYEIGDEAQEHYDDDIIGEVDRFNESNGIGNMNTRIHEAWYCVAGVNKRFYDVDVSIIEKLRKRKIPVCVVITKVDQCMKNEIDDMKSSIKEKFPNMEIFTYASLDRDDPNKSKLIESGYIQQEELLQWAYDNLDESLKNGLLSSVNGALRLKYKHVKQTVIPVSGAAALAGVIGNSFVPVPFSDSVLLMGIQSTLSLAILNSYNIAGAGRNVVGSVIGSTILSTLGKTLANSLAKAIPGIGQAVVVANSTVAVSLTVTIGLTVNEICYRYMKNYIKNGDVTKSFEEFFTSNMFKEIFKEIDQNSQETIKKITDSILKKVNDKSKGE